MVRSLVIALVFFCHNCFADQQSSCVKDDLGRVFCAQPGGSAVQTNRGVVCGVGNCVTDDLGRVVCSRVQSGGVAKDDLGRPICLGGCDPAKVEMCIAMSK